MPAEMTERSCGTESPPPQQYAPAGRLCERKGMRIRLLGTGTPTPSLERMSSGYMVEIGKDVILFDQGPGTYHRMMEAGVRAVDVTHVFFSQDRKSTRLNSSH